MAATATWPVAASSGRRQSGSCGVQTRERRGGKQHRSSQRVQWWPRRARGGTGADEFDEDGRRFRGRRRRRWQRCGTSGASWLIEEVEGGPAELWEASGSRGVAGSHGGSRRWRRLRSGSGTEEGESVWGRERKQRGRKRGEGTRGVRGRLGNASVEAGGGRGGIGARHRAASVRGEEEDKGEEVGWAGQVGKLGRLGWTGRSR